MERNRTNSSTPGVWERVFATPSGQLSNPMRMAEKRKPEGDDLHYRLALAFHCGIYLRPACRRIPRHP